VRQTLSSDSILLLKAAYDQMSTSSRQLMAFTWGSDDSEENAYAAFLLLVQLLSQLNRGNGNYLINKVRYNLNELISIS
jgi:hypothetical protein